MDRIVTCPKCGKDVRARSGAAKCSFCGAVTVHDSSPTIARVAGTNQPPRKVAAANRKVCAQCGVDVTFAPRVRNESGQFLCVECSKPQELESPVAAEERPPLATMAANPSTIPTQRRIPTKRRVAYRRGPLLIALASVATLVILASAIFYITRPTWEDRHRDLIVAWKAEADNLSAHEHPREAYWKYKGLIDFVNDRPIESPVLRDDIAAAKKSMQRCYALALPLIQKDEAAERARVAAQQAEAARLEREKREQEAARARAEQLAREHEAQLRAQARREAAQAKKMKAFSRSAEYTRLKSEADSIVSNYYARLATEDSAYRGMSKSARAARELLAIYVKIRGKLNDMDVDAEVDRRAGIANTIVTAEDSAIRATHENDEAFFELLGVWCSIDAKPHPELQTVFFDEKNVVATRLIGDDSAIRAITAYTGASMHVLQRIVSAEGHADDAARIVSAADSENLFEDSAWRAAVRHSEANMGLLLTLFPSTKASDANRIRQSVQTSLVAEDSALRQEIDFEKGIIEALHVLIQQ